MRPQSWLIFAITDAGWFPTARVYSPKLVKTAARVVAQAGYGVLVVKDKHQTSEVTLCGSLQLSKHPCKPDIFQEIYEPVEQ